MKKFGLLVVGGIAVMILLSTIGPIAGMVISLAILYFVIKQFLKTDSTAAKIGLAIIGLIVLASAASNAPALFGVAAAYVLYLVYKKWNETKYTESVSETHTEKDPFVNFEKQWNELHKNY
ncbi:flagellar basal body rod protein [Neobacillus notoginsengisoli]|uniref:Flagellar basal body rod protein n=1 Tax=Neobacillus notoginsengisoli TaxID=1578198 RepID=A0A417YVW6_9BACI|nr:flagellar basal body rod protein [Neobacillus notoginsengisoli]RHW41537.1 flagellar basal body rod protein [Neobacillus notoginsengisoli]